MLIHVLASSRSCIEVQLFKTLNASVIGFDSVGFQGDEHDFSDNIAMQQEVNRLRGDVQKLQAECQHWKSLVPQNVSLAGLFSSNFGKRPLA